MPMLTDSQQSAVNSSRASIRTQMLNFCGTTLPPLAATLSAQITAADPQVPMFGEPADAQLYAACVNWLNRQIALGAFTGAPLPSRWGGV